MDHVSTNKTIPRHGVLVTNHVGKWIARKVFRKRGIAKSKSGFSQSGLKHLFTLEELELATNQFSQENLLGKGGFGFVYKGCLNNGNLVAVKVLHNHSTHVEEQFRAEIEVAGPLYHKNIVRLLGCCIDGSHRLLVREYVGNGTLREWLQGDKTQQSYLSWESRMKVLLGTAKAITYFHEEIEPKMVHRDIKSSNVLIDDEFNAKLSGFSLAKLLAPGESPVCTGVAGTIGYIDPTYLHSGNLSERSDVYSFGIVLLEAITGRYAVCFDQKMPLVDWLTLMVRNRQLEKVVDPNVRTRPSTRALKRALQTALRCIDPVSTRRPTMGEVVRMLESEDYPIPKPVFNSLNLEYSGFYRSDSSELEDNLSWRVDTDKNIKHWEEDYLYVEEFGSSDSEISGPHAQEKGINSSLGPHAQGEGMVESEPVLFCKQSSESVKGQILLDDGYDWRKYGTKEEKECTRNYYRCAYPKCRVKKRCVWSSSDGQVEVTYKGTHHHSNSKTTRRSPSSPSARENESINDDSPGQSFVSGGIQEIDDFERKEELKPLVGKMPFKTLLHDPPLVIKSELHGKSEGATGSSPEKGRSQQHLEEAVSISQLDLMETVASKVFLIHTLDLSQTSIKSLPEFISKLVALRVLILRGCELLMELRPEIGELTKLEVLDLEGTEIICLPKEIGKLVNLRSLKFSLCGYADQFQETERIGPIIPQKALSGLLRLNMLSIDVNPEGDWWNTEVKTVTDDLCSLQELGTLCLYLPTVDLLDNLIRDFMSSTYTTAPCFRFTVGHLEERLISRLPKEVVKDFNDLEKFEKGLKYVNGEGIPVEIKKALNHVDAFLLERHWRIKNLLEFGVENIDNLRICILLECNELQSIVNAKQSKGFDGTTTIFGSLEHLSIHYMRNMERIWRGPVTKGSLSNLKSLALHTCVSLTTIFTLDLLANLSNLEDLRIEDCPKIETLVNSSSPDLTLRYFLPNLKNLVLLELPNLGCISSCLPVAPKLERLVIFYCPKLDKLSALEISSRDLKVIKGEKLWWDALKWHESDMTEGRSYLTSKFIPLRKHKDLDEQFMRD